MKPVIPRSDRVRREWLRRVEAEYRSCAITQHLTLWLTQIAAPPSLVRDGLRIARDELMHAELSHRVYVAAGGREPPHILRESLALVRRSSDALEHDVLRTCIDTFCLGETVAVPLFAQMRRTCSVPVARRALDRVLRDEVRHRDFGWTLLAWMLNHPQNAAFRAQIDRELTASLARVRDLYTVEAPDDDLDAEERAWGLLPTRRYGDIVRRTEHRDYAPRFSKLGIDLKPKLEEAS
jgi:hypothetical protein